MKKIAAFVVIVTLFIVMSSFSSNLNYLSDPNSSKTELRTGEASAGKAPSIERNYGDPPSTRTNQVSPGQEVVNTVAKTNYYGWLGLLGLIGLVGLTGKRKDIKPSQH